MRHSWGGLALCMLVVATRPAGAEPDARLPLARVSCGDGGNIRELLVLPGADGVVLGDELAALDDAAWASPPKSKAPKRLTGEELNAGWCAASRTVKVGKQTRKLTVSSVGELTGASGDRFEESVTVLARPFTNKETKKLLAAGTLARPAALRGEPDGAPVTALRNALGDRARLRALWSDRDDVILAGSAAGELYQGAKARSTFTRWNLDLRLDRGVTWGLARHSSSRLAWVLGNVEATPAKGGAATPYRVLFVLLADDAPDGDPETEPERWRLVMAHFALVE